MLAKNSFWRASLWTTQGEFFRTPTTTLEYEGESEEAISTYSSLFSWNCFWWSYFVFAPLFDQYWHSATWNWTHTHRGGFRHWKDQFYVVLLWLLLRHHSPRSRNKRRRRRSGDIFVLPLLSIWFMTNVEVHLTPFTYYRIWSLIYSIPLFLLSDLCCCCSTHIQSFLSSLDLGPFSGGRWRHNGRLALLPLV